MIDIRTTCKRYSIEDEFIKKIISILGIKYLMAPPHRTGEAENRAATSDPQNEMTENFTKTVAFCCEMCYTKIICRNTLKNGGKHHAA